jgi:hypothetical protein
MRSRSEEGVEIDGDDTDAAGVMRYGAGDREGMETQEAAEMEV